MIFLLNHYHDEASGMRYTQTQYSLNFKTFKTVALESFDEATVEFESFDEAHEIINTNKKTL